MELSKIEKQLKKDINEWDELFAGNVSLSKSAKGVSTLSEKLIKLMDGSLRKTLKKGIQQEERRLVNEAKLDLDKAS